MTINKEKVFAFDIGTSSLGICVREGEEIKKLESLLIPGEYASTKDAALRRRMIRTRLAHRKREDWWRKCAKDAEIEVLETRQPIYDGVGRLVLHNPEPRMLREFSAQGDEIVYNSALLRIMLLQGKKLEGWQVFKAVWSALQHRGFMPASELPWAKKHKRNLMEVDDMESGERSDIKNNEIEDEKKNSDAANFYLKHISGYPENYRLPCYYEAEKMGLWDPKNPDLFKLRHEVSNPGPARNKGEVKAVAPRNLVEKEIKHLLENAAKLFPKLKGRENYVMYGETETPFASVNAPNKWSGVRGSEIEGQGVLGQKTPRFDNRAVNKCCLISRLNVCKADVSLNREVRFLLALKNMRYSYGGKPDCALEPLQIKELYDGFINNAWPKEFPEEKVKKGISDPAHAWRAYLYPKGEWKLQYHITVSQWRKWVGSRLHCEVNPAHSSISAPKVGGRSSYCRPALQLVKELMLSGQNPVDFYLDKIKLVSNTDHRKGLVKEDFEFVKEMGSSWYGIHIPDNRLKDAREMENPADRFARIQEIINDVRNPVVRHRLRYLVGRLQSLKTSFGEPERIMGLLRFEWVNHRV